MKKYILSILCCLIYSISISAQNTEVEVTGTVYDFLGDPLIGVSVTVKDSPGLGTITNIDGQYKIKVKPYSYLVFSYVGYQSQEQLVKEDNFEVNVKMEEVKETILDEVAVTGVGPQKKITLTGAITTVEVETLKTPSSNLANALAGNVAGVMAMQTSGQPGENASEFWIRGISTFGGGASAMVLVDGFERNMNEINIEDIESFTVLKDASTTAIYGSRGANGVILITTKRGKISKVQIDAKAEYTFTTRTYTPKFVDGPTYASLLNEASMTRNGGQIYSDDELMMIREGLDPDIYANTDWMDLLLKDWAPTYRGSVNLRGGTAVSRYYISGSYVNEGGMYKTDQTMKEYDTNSNYGRWNYRMNVDMDLTKKTLIKVGVSGSLEKQNYTGTNPNDIWKSMMRYNPILMPAMYSNGAFPAYGENYLNNPWVLSTQTGYTETWKNSIQTNITLEQNLDFITEGLKFNARYGFDTFNRNSIQRLKWPEQWKAERQRDSNGDIVFKRVRLEELMKQTSAASGERKEFFEAEFIYNRTFGSHNVSSILKYTQDKKVDTSSIGSDIIKGVDRRHQGLAGNVAYNYENRYFINFNFGYNGSENFAKGHQYGFFPAFSGAWNVAEESFIKDKFSWLEMFKIRYSYGEVGNDYIGINNVNERFPYLPTFGNYKYFLYNNGAEDIYEYTNYNWGDLSVANKYNGLTYTQIASNGVTWEIAKKHDLGIDIYLDGDRFGLTIDYFKEKRSGIYMPRNYLSAITGLQSSKPRANLGSVKTEGFDGNFSFVEKIGNVDVTLRGNFTYSKNEIEEIDELYSRYPYTKQTGFRVDQARGLVALGLFKDYEDIRNSPKQVWSGGSKDITVVMPGDIKYKDINGDGVINNDDIVPIGSTTRPNLIYGFGLSASWKGFDFNIHFQGTGKSQFFINGGAVYPFRDKDWGNILTDVVESNRWILGENEDVNAKYPRLTYGYNVNNYRNSSYWLRDGSYLRLKTLELGYTLPKSMVNKLLLNKVRVYLLGQNLLTFSKFKLWDPEMGSSNGEKYPLSKTVTLGVTVTI